MMRWPGVVLSSWVVLINLSRVRSILCLFLFVWTNPAAGQSPALSLWRIDNLNATVFLLGSIHALKPEYYPLDPAINAAFQASEITVFEIDVAKISSFEIANIMQELGTYALPKSIISELQPETLALLNNYIEQNKLDIADFRQLRPWLISLRLGLLELSKSGFETSLGIDLHFQNKARLEKKTILQLETFSEQMALLAGDSKEVQDIVLNATLKEVDQMQSVLALLVSAWQSGAAQEMYDLSVDQTRVSPELGKQMERILDFRNTKMAEKIEAYLGTDKTYFVVVGALHMGGQQGLLNLLGEKYKITQVQAKRIEHSGD